MWMHRLVFFFFIFFGQLLLAKNSGPAFIKDLSLGQGAHLRILQINKKEKMIQVQSVPYPGEDYSWLKVDEFVRVIKKDKKNNVRQVQELKNLSPAIVGKEYFLEKKITTYVEASVINSK